jgi:hypothetical protein
MDSHGSDSLHTTMPSSVLRGLQRNMNVTMIDGNGVLLTGPDRVVDGEADAVVVVIEPVAED